MQRSAGLWTLHTDDVPEDCENDRNGKYQETNVRPNEETGVKKLSTTMWSLQLLSHIWYPLNKINEI